MKRHRVAQSSPLIDLYESRRSASSSIKEAQKDTARIFSKALDTGAMEAEEVRLDDLFEVFLWPQIEASGKPFDIRTTDFSEVREEMTSSQFLYATSKLIHPLAMAAYENDISDVLQLVTQVDSDHKIEDIAGTTDGDRARMVEEATPYPESGFSEKRTRIENFKIGHGTVITAEMLRLDQTGELQKRARDTGTYLADFLEDFIASRVTDTAFEDVGETTSQTFVYNGTRRAIYEATTHATTDNQTNPNIATAATPNRTSAKQMINLLKGMKSGKIRIRPRIVFGSDMMEEELNQFFTLQQFDISSGNKDVNPYRGKFQVVVSPYTPTTTEWYIGDFARQFRLQWVWRPMTVTDTVGDAKRDIVAGFYSKMWCGVGATDYRFVVQNAGV